MKTIPLGVKIITAFYILFASFYLLFGLIFSKILFIFGTLMAGDSVFIGSSLNYHLSQISSQLIPAGYPVWSLLFKTNFALMGLLSLISSLIIFIFLVKFFRGSKIAKYFIVAVSCFEVGVALSLFDLMGMIIHLIVHGSIIIYLLFSKSSREFFR